MFLVLLCQALALRLAQGQTTVDDQLVAAMGALKSTFTECNDKKFLECIAVTKDGFAVNGSLARTVNNRDERTDIKVRGNLTVADAQFGFNLDVQSDTTPSTDQFWRSETFEAVPGQSGSGVLEASLSPDPDNIHGGALGALICGNIVVEFSLLLFNRNVQQGDVVLVDATQAQLKGIMQAVGGAILAAGACATPGGLTVTPESVQFTADGTDNPAAQTVTLRNSGTASSWQATVKTDNDIPWLSISPLSGNLGTGQTVPLTVSANASGLSPGTYQGSIVLTPTGPAVASIAQLQSPPAGAKQVSVTLKVQGLTLDQKIAARNSALKLTIHGQDFTADSRPAFLASDGTEDTKLTLDTITLVNPGQITADLFVAPDADLGSRILRVQTGKNETRLPGAIKIVAIHLEYSQAAKTGADDDRVANHATVVRAFIDSPEPIPGITGLLYVFRAAGQISGSPFHPNAPEPLGTGDAALRNTLDAKPAYDPIERRYLRNSLNYYFLDGLPPSKFFKFFLALSAENPATPPPELKDLSVDQLTPRKDFIISEDLAPQSFVETKPLRLLLLVDNRMGIPAQNLVFHQQQGSLTYLRAAYPVGADRFVSDVIYDVGKTLINIDGLKPIKLNPNTFAAAVEAKLSEILRKRNSAAQSSGGQVFDRIVLLSDSSSGAEIIGTDSGNSDKQAAVIIKEFPATLAHEIGHTLGFGESYCGSCNAVTAFNPLCYTQPVNCRRDDAIEGRTGSGDDSGNRVEEGAVRLTPLLLYRSGRPTPLVSAAASVDTGNVNDGSTSGFFQWIALMGKASDDNNRWPETREWNHLLHQFTSGTGLGSQEIRRLAQSSAGSPEFLTVHGLLDVSDSAMLMDVFRSSRDTTALVVSPGDLRLDLLDAAGNSLSSVSFAVDFTAPERGLVTQVPFEISVPFTSAARQLRLSKGPKVLASRAVSANAPNVQVQTPGAGQTVIAPIAVSWSGSDPDGDSLTYSVFYLPDGTNRRPIASGLTGTSFQWDPTGSPGGAGARILVQASDGVNEASALSAPFTVAKGSPSVTLFSPQDGTTFPSGTPVTFAAAGSDPEDGVLSPAALSFRSSLDGDLGTGNAVTHNLSQGVHVITVRGTDQDGNSAEAKATITVAAAGTVPVLESVFPDTGPAGSEITLAGQSLDLPGLKVAFGIHEAPIVQAASTQLVVRVPPELAPGKASISVSREAASSSALDFQVLAGKPQLLFLEPDEGGGGTIVILRGGEFASGDTVHFGTMDAPILAATHNNLVVAAPRALPSGDVPVTVDSPQGSSQALVFRMSDVGPVGPVVINSIQPLSGSSGTRFLLEGKGFSPFPTRTFLTIGGMAVVAIDLEEGSLAFTLPEGVSTGVQSVIVTVNGYPSNPVDLTVLPAQSNGPKQAEALLSSASVRFESATASQAGLAYTLDLTSLPSSLPPNGELYPTFDPFDFTHTSDFILSGPGLPQSVRGSLFLDVPAIGDLNHNGLDDFFDSSQAVPAIATTGEYDSDTDSGVIDAKWSRQAKSTTGSCTLHLTSDNGGALPDFTAAFQLLEYSGTLTYVPGGDGISASIQLAQAQTGSNLLGGPIFFTQSATNRLNLLNFQAGKWTNQSGATLTFDNGSAQRSSKDPNFYTGLVQFTDGDPATEGPDYIPWNLVISDRNDSNGNGVPDLSDDPQPSDGTTPRFTSVRLGSSQLILEWPGTPRLQAADQVIGPWQEISAASSPHRVNPAGSKKFFRLIQ